MSVIEAAQKRLEDECRNGEDYTIAYWAAYLDGAKAQKREDEEEGKV